MTAFVVVSDLKIGHVVEVSGTSVRAELLGDVTELTRSYEGRVYAIGQIGSIIKIHFGRRLVFGFVTLLRMRSDELLDAGKPIPIDADQRVMEIELFAEGGWNTAEERLSFSRGVSIYPLPLQGVFLLTGDEAAILYKSAEGQRIEGANPLVAFATYVGADGVHCRANIDKMFAMHCAVLGSTGSGKSGAVAALLHSVLDHSPVPNQTITPRIIMIDPHGEYGQAFGDRAAVFRAYDPIGAGEALGDTIKLPYWLMSAEEFRFLTIGKTEHEATSQHNIIYKALTHARMVAAKLILPAPTDFVTPLPADDADGFRRAPGVDPKMIISFDRDRPRPFSLDELVNHIIYVQAINTSAANVRSRQSNTDMAKNGFKSILDKISVLRVDPRIDFLMKNWLEDDSPKLGEILEQFVGKMLAENFASKDIRILDISGLPNEVAGPLTAMLARLLFQYKLFQTTAERDRDPILLVCEEAHRYVPNHGEAEYAAAQMAIRRIAREGRKYGLGLMLVSQRPSDVESTVISQCGTWLVLRLTNSADQQHVSRFLPDGLSGMTKALPALAQQEALFVGEGAALPARVRIIDLPVAKLPRSASIRFAEGWSKPNLSAAEIAEIASRMAPGNVQGDADQEENDLPF